jgi:hypothetical protein
MSFSVDLQKFADKSKVSLLTARNGICLNLFGAVVMSTPVLTGRLRGNWQCSLNTAITDPAETEDKAGTETIRKLTAVVNGSTLNDTTVMLSNNLPYAYRIEFDGWSHTKAPNGMLRINVERISSLLNKQTNA